MRKNTVKKMLSKEAKNNYLIGLSISVFLNSLSGKEGLHIRD